MDKDHVKVGVWIPKRTRVLFAVACRYLGVTMSEVLRRAIDEAILAVADMKTEDDLVSLQATREQGEGT